MAFDQTKMAALGASLTTADVPTAWSYINASDSLAVISASGYFNNWTNNLGQNDTLYIVGSDGANLSNVTSVTGATPVTLGSFITAGDIADGSITAAKLATNAVETAKINALAVTNAKMAANSVTTTNITDGNVTAAKIGTDAVTTVKILNANVTDAKLATNAVTTAKITDANVTLVKLAAGITPSHVTKFAGKPTTVGGAAIEDFTVAGVLATDIPFAVMNTEGAAPVDVVAVRALTDTLRIQFSADPGADHVVNYMVIRAAA